MKFPNTIFVKHFPDSFSGRKEFLTQHLENRLVESVIKDIRWVEDYNHDHPFVQWLNIKLNIPHGTELTSNFVKSLIICKQMVDENIESAILINDDVTFHKNWKYIFEKIPDEVALNNYINLGISPFFNLKPLIGEVHKMPTNGNGCEAVWITRDFAKGIIENLNMEEPLDVVYHGYLISSGRSILNVPICHQTSNLENVSDFDYDTRVTKNRVAYVNNYMGLKKYNFNKLLEDFKEFGERKCRIENKFEEIFGKHIDIKNVKYILNDDTNYKLNILDYELIKNEVDI